MTQSCDAYLIDVGFLCSFLSKKVSAQRSSKSTILLLLSEGQDKKL